MSQFLHLSQFLHSVGSYPLLFTLFAQFFVLAQARKSGDKLMASQAICLIGANSIASVALALRPHSPPQTLPDALGTVAAVLLLAPAAAALKKMQSQQEQEEKVQKEKVQKEKKPAPEREPAPHV